MIYHMSGGGGTPITPPFPTIKQFLSGDGNTYISRASYSLPKGRILNSTERSSDALIPAVGGTTVNPGTQTITAVQAGKYVSGNIYVAGDSNLTSANIVSGKSIFGVPGSAFSFSNYTYKEITLAAPKILPWADSFFIGAKMLCFMRAENGTYGSAGTNHFFITTAATVPASGYSGSVAQALGMWNTTSSAAGAKTVAINGVLSLNPASGTLNVAAPADSTSFMDGIWFVGKWY